MLFSWGSGSEGMVANIEAFEVDDSPLCCLSGFCGEYCSRNGGIGEGPGVSW